MRTIEEFMDHVALGDEGCWNWTGRTNVTGYGQVWWLGRHQKAHRVAYSVLRGPIPDGLVIDHLCRNRCCVNPEHMEPVTIAENIRRGRAGEANSNGEWCRKGVHPWPESAQTNKDGWQRCRECARARHARNAAVQVICACGREMRRNDLRWHQRLHGCVREHEQGADHE